MDGDGQRPAGAFLVGIPHQLDEDERKKQGGQEIEGAVLVAGDAEIGAGLLAGKFQVDLIIAGDIADVLVLEHLEPGAQADDDAAPDTLRGLLENAVGGLGRVGDEQPVKQVIQFLFAGHG